MELDVVISAQNGSSLVIAMLLFIGVFLIANGYFVVKKILIGKNILVNDTTFKAKKLNIIFMVVSLIVCLVVITVSALTFSYAEGAFNQALIDSIYTATTNFFALLLICQIIYFVIRLTLENIKKIKAY